jgi:hypothetical protein
MTNSPIINVRQITKKLSINFLQKIANVLILKRAYTVV